MDWYKLSLTGISRKLLISLIDGEINKNDISIKKYVDMMNNNDLSNMYQTMQNENIRLINYKDEEYPEKLLKLPGFPLFLFLKGKTLDLSNRSISVVGTRENSIYGKLACINIVSKFKEYDITVISGLANGIDTIALDTAIKNSINVIAVVANGLNVIYPANNRELYEKISRYGTLISEYPPDTSPDKWRFPKRNRIIVGLSDGTLIVESFEKGGSLISSKYADDYNKPIFAVPGCPTLPSFEGCNYLIKNNIAKLTTEVKDIVVEYNWDINIEDKREKLNDIEKRILSYLKETKQLDDIIKEFKINKEDAIVILVKLKILGLIKEINANKEYCIIN